MAKTTIYYFHTQNNRNPVREFIISLQPHQQAKIRRILQTIVEYGLSTIIPHIKKLSGTPLWEIRVLGKDSIRIIYAVKTKDHIILLHGFIKKTQKTPFREIETALFRWKDWQSST